MKNEKIVYDGFHKIIMGETEVKNRRVKREKLIVKSAVGGIVIDEDNRIALVSQYRPVPERWTKEIPAGVLDKEGLTPVETLVEELMEECMIPKEDIISISKEPIHEYYMMVGNANATIYLYEIHVKKQENKEVTDKDVDSVEWVDVNTMKQYIDEHKICDGKTIISYYHML